jgi:DNA-binding NarL/FixJ family response regulator
MGMQTLAERLLGDLAPARRVGRSRRPDGLSPREVEVLRLVAQGQTNREIALTLALSEQTVANHLTAIYTKLNLDNRASATAYALREGLA